MQKNYRDYTVGELLDMGLKVSVTNYDASSEEEAFQLLSKFEGIKTSSRVIDAKSVDPFKNVRGWKEKFELSNFVDIKK